MTQEEKALLLKDLCARLPYGLKVNIRDIDYPAEVQAIYSDLSVLVKDIQCYSLLFECKPYLRPMSSMTEDEQNRYDILIEETMYRPGILSSSELINYLIAHHLDYHGLIPMGLALEATENMYNIK